MLEHVRQQQAAIAEVCRRYAVARLELFGSAATGPFDPTHSDLDFLVALHPHPTLSRFEQYFGLREALEILFSRPVDLMLVDAPRNPYLIARVNATRQLLYAA